MNYIHLTKQDIAVEESLLAAYHKLLEEMPPGRLTTKKNKGNIYYYCTDEVTGKQTYIPYKNRQLIYDLKQKRLLQETVKIMEQNLKYQKKLLLHYRDYDTNQVQTTLPKVYSDASLAPYEARYSYADRQAWAQGSYRKNPYHPENLIHKTSFGLVVRSKSEALIAELLHAAGIPFRYDCELNIRGRDGRFHRYYPDFTILTPQGNVIYWEHLGRLDDDDYAQGNFTRILDFYDNHIVAPDNLILTMDGPTGTIDVAAIKRIIDGQLLPLFQGELS